MAAGFMAGFPRIVFFILNENLKYTLGNHTFDI
jgi:hypothetical protein